MSTKEQEEKKQEQENTKENKQEEAKVTKAKPLNSEIVEKFDEPDLADI